jgi:hypothetical protein
VLKSSFAFHILHKIRSIANRFIPENLLWDKKLGFLSAKN